MCEALRARGVEVWFDQNELVGGDAWDTKIKKQIRECALFVPVISASTQLRKEGYFRREWNLATQRLLDMAPGTPFLLPVVIDETTERSALVAEEFLHVQWSRLPGGEATPVFVARVIELLHVLAAPAPEIAVRRTPTMMPLPAPAPRKSRNPWAVVAALVVAAASFWIVQRQGWLKDSGGISGTKQLAVLPFKNIGESPGNQAFSDGLSETITAQLTQLQQFQQTLLVVPMSEVRREAIGTASQARSVFGATLALTGSVQREASVVRVTVSLVDARSLRILRSATLDNAPTESYRLQDRVAAQTAEWLGLELSVEAKRVLAAGQTSVASANELFLQGRGELARRDLPGNLDAAIVHLQQALVSDPRYALAHAALGEAFWAKYFETKSRLWVDEARRSCQSALEFGASLSTPHVTLSTLLTGTGQYEKAVEEAQTALRLDPANAEATRALARAYARLNHTADAEAAYRRAIERNPSNGFANMDLAVFYWVNGRYAEAEKNFLRVAELMPDNYLVYRNLGGLYVMMNRPEPAAELLQKSLALKPTAPGYSNLGTLRFQQQRYTDAATLYEQASNLNPRDYVLLGNLADALRFIPARAAEASAIYVRAIRVADETLLVNPKDAAVRAVVARYSAFSGDSARAVEEITQARTLAPANLPVVFNSALVFERLGQRDRALESLGLAIKGGYAPTEIQQHPDLKELRADPRFVSLISAPPKSVEK